MAIEREEKTGKDAYHLWNQRIRKTLEWRRREYDTDWQRLYDMYEGNHWRENNVDDPRADDPRDRITLNKTASVINNIVPFLLNKDVKVHGKARKPDSDLQTKIKSAVVNYEWHHQEMQEQAEKCLYDFAIIGHLVCKTGYTLEIDEAAAKADGDIVYDDYIQKDSSYLKRIDPFLFLFDPNASEYNLQTARWCCEIFFQYINDVVANDSYDKKVREKIKDGTVSITRKNTLFGAYADGSPRSGLEENDLPDCELAVMYEIWDKKFNKVLVFADGCDEPLKEIDNPYPHLKGEFPYIKADYFYVPNKHYGIGLGHLTEDIQFETDRRRTYALNHARRFNRKYEVPQGMDESEKIKLVTGEDGTVIETKVPGGIRAIEDAPISQDYRLLEGLLDKDFQEMSGLDALLRGGNLPSRTTKGEVDARANIFMLKLDGRIRAVERFLKKAITQIAAHISANTVIEKAVKILGAEGEYWERYDAESLKEEVDWEMEAVNAPKTDPEVERQQKIQIFQIIMNPLILQLIQSGLLKINLNELFKWVLESFENLKDIGKFFSDALITNVPLQTTTQASQQQEQVPENVQGSTEIASQTQGAAITNQGGLQV